RHGLRDEEKFGSVDELKEQIARDFEHARAWIAENGSVKSTN
ncbi:MAG: riboflavin kinase, partial [Pseudomonadota bacterium]|nr:riboflavin kinase [Pseudomonadota bacterium]